jgi:flagellar motor switch protein FliG
MFIFEDILQLDSRSVQQVLKEVDNKELGIALKGSSEELKAHIFGNLSKRLSAMIQEDMDFMGPIRRADMEEAQQKIVNVVRRLQESGDIIVARGGGDDIVV